MNPTRADWAALTLLGVIWGTSFMSVTLALQTFGPLTLAGGRTAIAAAVLVAVVLATRRPIPRDPRAWLFVLLFGIFSNALPFFLLNWAQQTVSSSFAGIMMATVPFYALVLAVMFVPGERFAWSKLAGLMIGFAGVMFLIGPAEILTGPGTALPRLACAGAALCYALGALFTRLAPPVDPLAYSAGGLGLAALLTLPAALVTEGLPQAPTPTGIVSLIYLALGPTALAAILLVRTIRSAGPTFVTLVNYMVPVWAVLFGVLLLNEALPSQIVIAMGLIFAGLAVNQSGAIQGLYKR